MAVARAVLVLLASTAQAWMPDSNARIHVKYGKPQHVCFTLFIMFPPYEAVPATPFWVAFSKPEYPVSNSRTYLFPGTVKFLVRLSRKAMHFYGSVYT